MYILKNFKQEEAFLEVIKKLSRLRAKVDVEMDDEDEVLDLTKQISPPAPAPAAPPAQDIVVNNQIAQQVGVFNRNDRTTEADDMRGFFGDQPTQETHHSHHGSKQYSTAGDVNIEDAFALRSFQHANTDLDDSQEESESPFESGDESISLDELDGIPLEGAAFDESESESESSHEEPRSVPVNDDLEGIDLQHTLKTATLRIAPAPAKPKPPVVSRGMFLAQDLDENGGIFSIATPQENIARGFQPGQIVRVAKNFRGGQNSEKEAIRKPVVRLARRPEPILKPSFDVELDESASDELFSSFDESDDEDEPTSRAYSTSFMQMKSERSTFSTVTSANKVDSVTIVEEVARHALTKVLSAVESGSKLFSIHHFEDFLSNLTDVSNVRNILTSVPTDKAIGPVSQTDFLWAVTDVDRDVSKNHLLKSKLHLLASDAANALNELEKDDDDSGATPLQMSLRRSVNIVRFI